MRSLAFALAFSSLVVACSKTPAEPEPPPPPAPKPSATAATPSASASAAEVSAAAAADTSMPVASGSAPTPTVDAGPGKSGPDPHNGKFTLAEATKPLKGSGAIIAKIDTTKGALQCKLFDDKAPITVANFIGLATGKRAWKDPTSNLWVSKPAYDGTTFHRIIKGFMIQGGDQKGNGTGEPGYVIPDEIWTGAKHDKAGLLCMANRGKNTNGAQFFITDAAAAHLDGGYTIFGECAPEKIVHDIADVPVKGENPSTTVTIKSVTISRDEKKAK